MPLGMKDTGFEVESSKQDRYGKMYDRTAEGVLFENEIYIFCINDRKRHNPFQSGGAGLVSTIDDYGRFARMLVNGGELEGTRLLKPETVKKLLTPSMPEKAEKDLTWDSVRGYTYANLMRIFKDREAAGYNGSPGEFGWDGWTDNYFCCDPENRLIFLFFIQMCGGVGYAPVLELKKLIYGD